MIAGLQTSPTGVRFRLREATAEAHRQVEEAMALAKRCTNRESYLSLLEGLLGVYAPLEEKLAALPWDDFGINFEQRVKAPWLHADLTRLGLSDGDIAVLPRTSYLPSIQCPADGFGALYVLEGASLGGQIILREIKSRLGLTESDGARFFASYGPEVGERWRGFLAAMTAYGDTETRAQAMQRTALATFECFSVWMNQRALHADEGARHDR